MMNNFDLYAQPVILAPTNPDSPYNNMSGMGLPVDCLRPPSITQTDPGYYEGPFEDEMRHGVGTCTWFDGSSY